MKSNALALTLVAAAAVLLPDVSASAQALDIPPVACNYNWRSWTESYSGQTIPHDEAAFGAIDIADDYTGATAYVSYVGPYATSAAIGITIQCQRPKDQWLLDFSSWGWGWATATCPEGYHLNLWNNGVDVGPRCDIWGQD